MPKGPGAEAPGPRGCGLSPSTGRKAGLAGPRHVKAVTAGIAECVTEDHLPIRWNYGTRPAKYWHWRAIRRCNPFPSYLCEQQLQLPTSTTTAWYGTANYLLRLRKLRTATATSIRQAWNPFRPLAPVTLTGSWRETRAPSQIGPAGSAVVLTSQSHSWTVVSCPRQLRCSSLSTRGTLHTRPDNV
jgi:hypothetical protein